MSEVPNRAPSGSVIRSPIDFAGGLFLLAIAGIGYAGAFTLPFGQLSGIGSGLLPKVVSVLVAAFGVFLLLQSLVIPGERLERWSLRRPLYLVPSLVLLSP